MKRLAFFAACLLLLSCLAGCAAQAPSAQATPTPLPTPTPAPPEGMEKVFGREVSVAFWGEGGSALLAGVAYEAARLGIPVTTVTDAAGANAADLCIGYALDAAQREALAVPLVLFTTDNRSLADGLIYYDNRQEAALAWDVLFDYPAHEAPIRLLALFAAPQEEEPEALSQTDLPALDAVPGAEEALDAVPGAEEAPQAEEAPDADAEPAAQAAAQPVQATPSLAAELFAQWQAEGKLYSRGAFTGPPQEAAAWTEQALSGVTVGLLDTIYAETPALARAGYEALLAAARSDAVEIIAAGLDADILDAMIEEHFLMGAAVGPDCWSAGALALRMGLGLLLGEAPAPVQLAPVTLYSEDVYAAVKAGETDPAAIAIALDDTLRTLCQYEPFAYLEQYYAG